MTSIRSDAGFSLVELLVATGLLLIVSGIVTGAMLQMTKSQATIWNRTAMHSGIRGATELLQQEVGQAGRASVSATVSLAEAVNAFGGADPHAQDANVCDPGNPGTGAATVTVVSKDAAGNTVTSVNGINPLRNFYASAGPPPAYMLLTTMDGNVAESIKLNAINLVTSQIAACFQNPHAAGTVLMPLGGFATGIIAPCLPTNGGELCGSDGTHLKLFGDINGDGNMVYVEYFCDVSNADSSKNALYRNVMAYDTLPAAKPATNTPDKILLSNILANPGGAACFSYQLDPPADKAPMTIQGAKFRFVLGVAITLTVESEQVDPITKLKQQETKALLNVSPRNVFNAFGLASIGYTDRIQSTPITITALVP